MSDPSDSPTMTTPRAKANFLTLPRELRHTILRQSFKRETRIPLAALHAFFQLNFLMIQCWARKHKNLHPAIEDDVENVASCLVKDILGT